MREREREREMCGIGLIVSGVRIDLSSLLPDFPIPAPQLDQPFLSIEDIKAALERRGPDSIGSKDFFLHAKAASCLEEVKILPSVEGVESIQRDSEYCNKKCDCRTLTNGESYVMDNGFSGTRLIGHLHFIGATLQLRGINPIAQPLVDTFGNILVYNGEVFGGILVNSESNDTEVLMESLRNCCTCSSQHTGALHCSENGKNSVPELLSTIKGPWALIYWQESSKTIWFGRDAFGRRSLLVHWPTSEDSRFLLSSVAPSSSLSENFEDSTELNFWEELSCGVYSISTSVSKMDGNLAGEAQKHQWREHVLTELIEWNRISVEPTPQQLLISREKIPGRQQGIQSATSVDMLLDMGHMQSSDLVPLQSVLSALRESVRRRATFKTVQTVKYTCSNDRGSPVAVLFSGGIDSMILAALLDECLDPKYDIDLLNVSFDGESAPDRMSAKSGLKELRKITPLRRWKLVEIDADLSELTLETKHVMTLINPAKTYMDLNIGVALWLAAGGAGWISENKNPDSQHVKYKSESRILLVGSGADEQCAGYGRHRTKYREGSWARLNEEMKLDMQRIWKRNLGRDDRCIADNGKEARFPYLDEDVIRTLLAIPLWEIADLDQPSGIGDKKILREVAKLLGLHEAAVLPKRAIQFGSRIARESNRKNFGSNRAANQASAGSVVISMASNCY